MGREAHRCGSFGGGGGGWNSRWGGEGLGGMVAGLTTLLPASLAMASRPLISSASTRGHVSAFPQRRHHLPAESVAAQRRAGAGVGLSLLQSTLCSAPTTVEPSGSATQSTNSSSARHTPLAPGQGTPVPRFWLNATIIICRRKLAGWGEGSKRRQARKTSRNFEGLGGAQCQLFIMSNFTSQVPLAQYAYRPRQGGLLAGKQGR